MKYRCTICGYIYDDAKESVPFADLPDDWKCPLCGAPKKAFVPVDEKPATPAPSKPVEVHIDEDMTKLSIGQMAALCSNLARGCEKQYKAEEMKLFTQLAEYFTSITPAIQDAEVKNISEMLMKDTEERYQTLTAVGKEKGDRGALRVCVWGEKITRMLSSLLERYNEEGEAFLENTEIWVCSICGFVYVGDQPPAICPVCSVPPWKFDKVVL